MNKLLSSLCILLVIVATPSCRRTWSDEERAAFKDKCEHTDTCSNFVVEFKGFDNNEFDSVLVKEYKDSTLLRSFKLFVEPSQGPSDKRDIMRYSTVSKKMNIHNTYQFILPGQKPYVLANMKMVMWAQFTMTNEGWGCVMGDYTIDGVRFEENANPMFVKREETKTK